MFDKIKLKKIDLDDIFIQLQLIRNCIEKIDDEKINKNEFLCQSIYQFTKNIEMILKGRWQNIKLPSEIKTFDEAIAYCEKEMKKKQTI